MEQTKRKVAVHKIDCKCFRCTKIPWNRGKKGYNSGKKNPMYGKTHSKDALEKMIAANLGTKDSEETRLKKSLSHKGINPSKWGAGFKVGNNPWNLGATRYAYLAGIVDGEGSISIVNSGNKFDSFGNKYKKTTLTVSMVDKGPVELFYKTYGGFFYERDRSDQINRQNIFSWIIQGKALDKLLYKIKPFLMIKTRQAEIILEYRKLQKNKRLSKGGPGSNKITKAETDYRIKLEAELKSLKLNKGTHVKVI